MRRREAEGEEGRGKALRGGEWTAAARDGREERRCGMRAERGRTRRSDSASRKANPPGGGGGDGDAMAAAAGRP